MGMKKVKGKRHFEPDLGVHEAVLILLGLILSQLT
jgi:hypothetical protein